MEDDGSGNLHQVPGYDKCLNCGLTAEAWPLESWQRICMQYELGGTFRTAFDAARTIMLGQVQRSFQPSFVTTTSENGFRIESRFWFVEEGDFTSFFGQPPDDIAGLMVVSGVTTADGRKNISGVLIPEARGIDPPKGLICSLATMYSDQRNNVCEYALTEAQVFRQGQSLDIFEFVNKQCAEARGKAWAKQEREKATTISSFAQLQTAISEIQQERQNSASLAFSQSSAPMEPRARRGVVAPSLIAVPTAPAPPARKRVAGRKPAGAAGFGRGGCGQRRGRKDFAKSCAAEDSIDLDVGTAAKRRRALGSEASGSQIADFSVEDLQQILSGERLGRSTAGAQFLVSGSCCWEGMVGLVDTCSHKCVACVGKQLHT